MGTAFNGATKLFADSTLVTQYASQIKGLNLQQAQLALSTKILTDEQKEEVLIEAGLIASKDKIKANLIQEALLQNKVNKEKSDEILINLGLMDAETHELLTQKFCTQADLEATLIQEGKNNVDTEAILKTLGVGNANLWTADTFKLLGKSIKQAFVSLMTNPYTYLIAGLVGVVTVVKKTSETIEEVRDKAQELGDTFNTSKSEIEGYKSQIQDLYKTINDGGSSIQEVTTARQTLMAVQDELIDKFGDEKETIDLVTQAIYGQTTALDALTQKQWQATKNEFNESDMWNDYANWQEGYSDNIDRMVNEMENAWGNIKMSTSDYFGGEYDDIIKRLEKAGWEYSSAYETFVKGGSTEDLYEEILDIQTLVGEDMPDNFLKSLTDDANKLKDTLDDYEGMWDTYILNDRIFADKDLADSWKEVNDAYTKYQNAVASGDKTAIEEATSGFATSINEVLNDENVSDSVKDYFKDMYPALYREVEKWEFKTNIVPEFDTTGLNGKTQADILKMLQTDGIQDGEDVFNSILESADKYGLVIGEDSKKIQQLLDLLVEWGVLQGTISDEADKDNEIDVLTPQIKNLQGLSDGFEKLDTLYADIKDGGSFDFGNLADDKFIEIFSGYTEEYNNFIKTVSSSPTDINACQSAFNNLVTAWVDGSGALSKLDASNLQVTKDMLTNMGVTNASEVVNDRYVQSLVKTKTSTEEVKRVLADETKSLADVADAIVYTEEEKEALIAIHPELRDQFDTTNKGIQLEETVYESLGGTIENLRVAQINAQLEQTRAVIEGSDDRINAYAIELTAIQSLATALSAINGNPVNSAVYSATDFADYQSMMEQDSSLTAMTSDEFNLLKKQNKQGVNLGMAYEKIKDLKIESANINYGGGKKTQDGSGSGSSKDPKEYDDHREYSDYYDEILSTRQQDIANIEAENEILNHKFEKALEDGDIATAEAYKNSINDNLETIKGLRPTYATELRGILDNEIMSSIIEIGGQFGFDWTGLNIDEISDVEIEKVIEGLQDRINIQKDIGVDMENAGKGDNATAIKDAELAKTMFEERVKTAEAYNDAVGNANGEGEFGLKWLEEQGEQLENNLKLQEAKSEELQDQSDDIEHQIDLQRNAFNGDDVSLDHIEKEIALRKKQQEIAHQNAELWREYYRALGYTEEAIEKTDEVQEAQKSWWDAEQAIYDLYQEAIDKAIKGMDKQIETLEYEYEQQNLVIDALEKKYELQRKLREEQRELKAEYEATKDILAVTGDDGTLFNKEDYDDLLREIKGIDSEITSLYEDYRDAINGLGENEWYKQEEITNEFERQQEALLDQYEIAKKQLEVTKQRTKLENVINNKNKRTLIGGKWVQTADLQAVFEERKNLLALEDEEYELRRKASENKQISAMRNLNDATNTEAKAVQYRIDMINDMTAQERKALAQSLMNVEDMDSILDGLNEGTLPKFVKVINEVMDNLGKLADVDYSSGGTYKGDYGASGDSSYKVNITVNGTQDGYLDEDGGFKMDVALPKFHTGRVRGLKPDEEKVIVQDTESIFTKKDTKDIAGTLMQAKELSKATEDIKDKLIPVDEFFEKLGYKPIITDFSQPLVGKNTSHLTPVMPKFNFPTLPSITPISKTNNTANNQTIHIDNVVVKEPIQDMGGFMRSVMQEAKLYNLRTKNIR